MNKPTCTNESANEISPPIEVVLIKEEIADTCLLQDDNALEEEETLDENDEFSAPKSSANMNDDMQYSSSSSEERNMENFLNRVKTETEFNIIHEEIEIKDERFFEATDSKSENKSNKKLLNGATNKPVMKRIGRTSQIQFETLVQFMQKHPDLAKNKYQGIHGKEMAKVLWKNLTDELNCEAGPQKQTKQWQSTWNDWKTIVKRKWRLKYGELNKTGGGEPTKIVLSPTDEKLLALLGYSAIEGDEKTPGAGIVNVLPNNPIPEMQQILELDVPIDILSTSVDVEIRNKRSHSQIDFQPEQQPHLEQDPHPSQSQPKKRKLLEDEEFIDNQRKQIKLLEENNAILHSLVDSVSQISSEFIRHNDLIEKFIHVIADR